MTGNRPPEEIEEGDSVELLIVVGTSLGTSLGASLDL
jgi:hypothetical protein